MKVETTYGKPFGNLKAQFEKRVVTLNTRFNRFSNTGQKICLILFGVMFGSICVVFIGKALFSQSTSGYIAVDKIQTPNTNFMQEENSTMSEEDLIPIGKMKGMIEGEYEAFYVAVDKDGKVFINNEIDYSPNAYKKSNGWQNIRKEQLDEYSRELRFIPNRTKGLKF